MTLRTEWRRDLRQALARLGRLYPLRRDAIGAGIYTAHCNRMLRSRQTIAATVADLVGHALSDEAVLAEAARIDMFAAHEPPVPWYIHKKRSGGTRMICVPDLSLKVRQRLLTRMLVAQHTPDPQIFNWKERGCSRQANQIKAALESGGRYVVSVDVQDCFQSVAFDAVYEMNLLPAEVIRFASDSRHLNLVHEPSPQVHSDDGDYIVINDGFNEQVGPRGLLQGLGSSDALWVSLIGDLPERLSRFGVPFIYCDNIVVVCDVRTSAVEAEKTLVRYFGDHRAGPLSLTTAIYDAYRGFEHTGYSFSSMATDDGISVMITPSVANQIKLFGRLQSDVSKNGARAVSLLEAQHMFDMRLSAFSATTDDYRHEIFSSFIAEIEGRGSVVQE